MSRSCQRRLETGCSSFSEAARSPRRPSRARPLRTKPRTPPGEGIRQLAAALPHSDEHSRRPGPCRSPHRHGRPLPNNNRSRRSHRNRRPSPPPPLAEPVDRAKLIRDAMRIRRNKAKRPRRPVPPRDRKKLQHAGRKDDGRRLPTNRAAPDAAPGDAPAKKNAARPAPATRTHAARHRSRPSACRCPVGRSPGPGPRRHDGRIQPYRP